MVTQSMTTHGNQAGVTVREQRTVTARATSNRPITLRNRRYTRKWQNFSAATPRVFRGPVPGTPGGMRRSLSVTSGPNQISDGA